jgi:acetyl esterase/lipase
VTCAVRAYGDHPDTVGDLYLPPAAPPPSGWPVVVLLHGGFWRERYRRDLMDALAEDLLAGGVAVWNLEYRRVRGAGGWPTTLTDVAAGVDHVATLAGEGSPVAAGISADDEQVRRLDPAGVTVVGHSAGGHLALWLAGRGRLPPNAPGARPRIRPARVVALAPVADLRAADAAGLSDRAARELLGGAPDDRPERWRLADPIRLVGHGTPVWLVHGDHDDEVPLDQSEGYRVAAAAARDPVTLLVGPWTHLELIDPASGAWQAVRAHVLGRRETTAPPPRPGRP